MTRFKRRPAAADQRPMIFVVLFAIVCAGYCAKLAADKGRNPFVWAAIGACTGLIGIVVIGRLSPSAARG